MSEKPNPVLKRVESGRAEPRNESVLPQRESRGQAMDDPRSFKDNALWCEHTSCVYPVWHDKLKLSETWLLS